MKQRKLVIGLLVILAVAVSGFTFAFWAGSLSGDDAVESNTVTIGTGEAVTTQVTLGASQDTGVLVPAGRADDSVEGNAVEVVVFSFVVDWNDTVSNDSFDGDLGSIGVVVDNIEINGSTTNAGLVNTLVGGATEVELNGATATVTVTVTLTEPADQATYNAVAGQPITFDVTITVTP
jgi:hypothetical protein